MARYVHYERNEDPGEAPYPRWVFRWSQSPWTVMLAGVVPLALITLGFFVTAIWTDGQTGGRLGATGVVTLLTGAVYAAVTAIFASEADETRQRYLNWVTAKADYEKYLERQKLREEKEFLEAMERKALANTPEPDLFGLREKNTSLDFTLGKLSD